MRILVGLPVVIPVLGAALCVLVGQWRSVQRVLAVTAVTSALAAAGFLLAETRDGDIVVARIGGWSPEVGITLVVDLLAALLLTVALATVLVVLVYSMGQGGVETRQRRGPPHLPGAHRRCGASLSAPATCSPCSWPSRCC